MTIDDDNAAALDRLQRERSDSLKKIVNEALRRGLKDMAAPAKPRRMRSFTRPVDTGECLVGNIDCIGDILGMLDDEKYR